MSAQGVIFAGGGTGGHIYPSIAIAERLVDHAPATRVSVICSQRAIDRRVLEPTEIEFDTIPAKPFGISPSALFSFAVTWHKALHASQRTIQSRLNAWSLAPEACVLVAMGGFVSAPAVWAARKLGLKRVLVNLDAVPGRANRFLAPRVDTVFSTYPFPGAHRVGPIVRSTARAPADVAACRSALGLAPDVPTLLVTGASQGAQSINEFVLALCAQHPHLFDGWQILHQAGEDQRDKVEAQYRTCNVQARVVGLIDQAGLMWGACDAALSRAGAGSVAEAWVNRIPTLFLPYPFHRDAHQKHNVAPLVAIGGAIVVDDLIDADKNVRSHCAIVERFLSDAGYRKEIKQRLAEANPGDGADEIAAAVQNL